MAYSLGNHKLPLYPLSKLIKIAGNHPILENLVCDSHIFLGEWRPQWHGDVKSHYNEFLIEALLIAWEKFPDWKILLLSAFPWNGMLPLTPIERRICKGTYFRGKRFDKKFMQQVWVQMMQNMGVSVKFEDANFGMDQMHEVAHYILPVFARVKALFQRVNIQPMKPPLKWNFANSWGQISRMLESNERNFGNKRWYEVFDRILQRGRVRVIFITTLGESEIAKSSSGVAKDPKFAAESDVMMKTKNRGALNELSAMGGAGLEALAGAGKCFKGTGQNQIFSCVQNKNEFKSNLMQRNSIYRSRLDLVEAARSSKCLGDGARSFALNSIVKNVDLDPKVSRSVEKNFVEFSSCSSVNIIEKKKILADALMGSDKLLSHVAKGLLLDEEAFECGTMGRENSVAETCNINGENGANFLRAKDDVKKEALKCVIWAKICNQMVVKILVDTDSKFSMTSRKMLNKLLIKNANFNYVRPKMDMDGEVENLEIVLDNCLEFEVKLGKANYECDFHVMREISCYDIILGLDFLTRHNFSIFPVEAMLKTKSGEVIKLHTGKEKKFCYAASRVVLPEEEVRLEKDLELAPGTTRIIKIKKNGRKVKSALSEIWKKNKIGISCLKGKIDDDEALAHVTNFGDKIQRLHRGMKIAIVHGPKYSSWQNWKKQLDEDRLRKAVKISEASEVGRVYQRDGIDFQNFQRRRAESKHCQYSDKKGTPYKIMPYGDFISKSSMLKGKSVEILNRRSNSIDSEFFGCLDRENFSKSNKIGNDCEFQSNKINAVSCEVKSNQIPGRIFVGNVIQRGLINDLANVMVVQVAESTPDEIPIEMKKPGKECEQILGDTMPLETDSIVGKNQDILGVNEVEAHEIASEFVSGVEVAAVKAEIEAEIGDEDGASKIFEDHDNEVNETIVDHPVSSRLRRLKGPRMRRKLVIWKMAMRDWWKKWRDKIVKKL